MMSSACAGLLMRLLAPADSTADLASIPISAVSAMMGSSSINTSRIYLKKRRREEEKNGRKKEKEEINK